MGTTLFFDRMDVAALVDRLWDRVELLEGTLKSCGAFAESCIRSAHAECHQADRAGAHWGQLSADPCREIRVTSLPSGFIVNRPSQPPGIEREKMIFVPSGENDGQVLMNLPLWVSW
jgi:hypothetical protein